MLLVHEELNKMDMIACLPKTVNSIEYAKNHHYIKLKDDKGESTELIPRHIIKYICQKCNVEFILFSNYGKVKCPVCGDVTTESSWGCLQIGFIPENESKFSGITKDNIINKDDEILE